jgi:exopolysaccharide biosynthesis predicted pyruvyltransferase EpsI
MKQTAVEWLVKWLKNNPISYGNSYDKAIEQANKMFEEQIKDAYIEASANLEDIIKEEAENYYKKTFKSE